MLQKDFREAARFAEEAAPHDPILALNAGELLYSGRPGLPADAERSGRCYVYALRQISFVEELGRFNGADDQYAVCARAVLLNAHEVATRVPPVSASADAIREIRKLHKELEGVSVPSLGVLCGRIITGFSAGLSYWDESKAQERERLREDSIASRHLAIKHYRHAIDAETELQAKGSSGEYKTFVQSALRIAVTAKENLMVLQGHAAALGPEFAAELMMEQLIGETVGASPAAAIENSARYDSPCCTEEFVSVAYASPARELFRRGAPEAPVVCANPTCVKVMGLKRCSCEKVWYCGRACQKSHWKAHKSECQSAHNEALEPKTVRVGSVVQLRNLQQAPDLNGMRGEVIGKDAVSGRWCVKLFGSGETKMVTEFKLFVVEGDLPENDPALALVEKQEAEFNNWGNSMMSHLRRMLREDRDPASGSTFLQQFELVWREWDSQMRQSFLQSVLVDAKLACKTFMQHSDLWILMASEELSDLHYVKKASPFLAWLSYALDGKVDTARTREAVGMKKSLTGREEFNLGIEELKGHPQRLHYDLRIFSAFVRMFKAQYVQSLFKLAIDAM